MYRANLTNTIIYSAGSTSAFVFLHTIHNWYCQLSPCQIVSTNITQFSLSLNHFSDSLTAIPLTASYLSSGIITTHSLSPLAMSPLQFSRVAPQSCRLQTNTCQAFLPLQKPPTIALCQDSELCAVRPESCAPGIASSHQQRLGLED